MALRLRLRPQGKGLGFARAFGIEKEKGSPAVGQDKGSAYGRKTPFTLISYSHVYREVWGKQVISRFMLSK